MQIANYAAMPTAFLPHVAGVVRDLASDDNVPVLIHCTAGKDRTGVLIAILLGALAVPAAEIEADYLRSRVSADFVLDRPDMLAELAKQLGFEPAADLVNALVGVDLDYLRAAGEAICSSWGSLRSYLLAAGVDDALLQRFTSAMTASGLEAP
jgi:protein-tyrosine phosphatase